MLRGEDLAMQRRTEEALRESEERYRTLVETSPDAIALSDTRGNILMTNHLCLTLVGHKSLEEMIGKNLIDLVVPQDKTLLAAAVGRVLETGSLRDLGLTMLRVDGVPFPVELSASAIQDTMGKVKAFVIVMRDITERKRLEEQFRQAQRMEVVGRLAGGVAHDFNNLLTVIQGNAQFAMEALPPGNAAREDIEEILKATDRAANLTRQLLAFSRHQVLQPQIVNPNALILEMDKMLRRLIGEDIELRTVPAPDLGYIQADPGQIEQILVNLAVNARDAMPNGGTLTVETANVALDEMYKGSHLDVIPGGFVMLAVSDTGIGMNEETKAHLFEPFFTTKDPSRGTGLGLATIYGIVKQHGGDLRVCSELGKGTVFRVYLPRVEGKTASSAQNGEDAGRPRGSETVLVVEDDPSVRNLVVRTLSNLGYTVLEAANGEEALKAAQEHANKVSLLLTDMIMPQMGGKELARRLVALNPQMRVLFASGYTEDAVTHHGILDKGMAFLPKPFTANDLARKVRQALQ